MVRKAAKDLVSKSFQLRKCWKPLYQALNREKAFGLDEIVIDHKSNTLNVSPVVTPGNL